MDGGPAGASEGARSVTDLAAEVEATRCQARLFALAERDHARGLVEVRGSDAGRWLDGMVTNETIALSPGGGCYAALLTPKGRIVADLHVLAREDGYWLDTSAWAVPNLLQRLERYIVADDVKLTDRTADFGRFSLEGPEATSLLGVPDVPVESWVTTQVCGVESVAARFGFSGETAWQLFIPGGRLDDVASALGVPVASNEALEILRIEAGIPLLGAELDEEVLPDEAGLDSAISRSKGCYTGQEIVARLHSRGAVNHRLVGLRFEGEQAPNRDSPLVAGERTTGEVTSACLSPSLGPIGLGFVRVEHAEPGTRLECAGPSRGIHATVVELPRVGR